MDVLTFDIRFTEMLFNLTPYTLYLEPDFLYYPKKTILNKGDEVKIQKNIITRAKKACIHLTCGILSLFFY